MGDRPRVPVASDGGAEGRPLDLSISPDEAFAVVVLESTLPLMVVSERTAESWRTLDEADRFTVTDAQGAVPVVRSVTLPPGHATRRVDLVRGRVKTTVDRVVFGDGTRRFSVSVEHGLYWVIRWSTLEEPANPLRLLSGETDDGEAAIPLDDHTWEEASPASSVSGLPVVLEWAPVRIDGTTLRIAFHVTRHLGEISVRVTETADRVRVAVHALWVPPVGDWFEEHLRLERLIELERPLGARALEAEQATYPRERRTRGN